MNPEVEGLDTLPGTYVFDLEVSHRAYRLNRFFWTFAKPEQRELFKADEEEAMRQARLTPEEAKMVRDRDWIGLIRYGVIFFVMEKFARVVGMSNLHVYAEMRGQSFDDFMKTRRVPDAR